MQNPLKSFFAGGFESASQRRPDRLQVDVLQATHHDVYAETDFRLLQQAGIFTVRDGLRWHLIERQAGAYDWSSFLPTLHASIASGTQVIWDLCHWGIPVGLDIFSAQFVARFATFARAAALVIQQHTQSVPLFCLINEISFWSWIGGDVGAFYPYTTGDGEALKRQLVRASIAAIKAVRSVSPDARFVQPEPIIHISADPQRPWEQDAARHHTESQFQAWDRLAADPSARALDIVGVNFYWNNQWIHRGDKTPLGHPQHKPLHQQLLKIWERYRRPILISETGTEDAACGGWLGYVCSEVRQAMAQGAAIVGICLYPVMDYPGWDDDRHCHCGLLAVDELWQHRTLREPLAQELRAQSLLFRELPSPAESLEVVQGDVPLIAARDESYRMEEVQKTPSV